MRPHQSVISKMTASTFQYWALVQRQPSALAAETFGTPFYSHVSVAGGLSAFLCLPFLCLCRLPHQLFVSEPLTTDAVHHSAEPANIVGFTGIIPIGFFIHVPKQVERLNADISAFDCSLQETPEVFDTVGVNPTTDVFFGVVDNLMGALHQKSWLNQKSGANIVHLILTLYASSLGAPSSLR